MIDEPEVVWNGTQSRQGTAKVRLVADGIPSTLSRQLMIAEASNTALAQYLTSRNHEWDCSPQRRPKVQRVPVPHAGKHGSSAA